MAEGHAVLRWARMLKPLREQPITSIKLPSRHNDRAELFLGEKLEEIETRGKHLIFHFSNDMIIHCHAMMYGSWQLGRPGMTLRKEEKYVRLRLATSEREAVFFHGPVVEVIHKKDLEKHKTLGALGPDILSPNFNPKEVWKRMQRNSEREIGDVILEQNVIAGIGNIYKSEGLYLASINPLQMIKELHRESADKLWRIIGPMMEEGARNNGLIITIPKHLRKGGERNWVYRRRGKPCFKCGYKIELVRQGQLNRSTYYCPNCQPSDICGI